MTIWRLVLALLLLACGASAVGAQQAVRVPVEVAGRTLHLAVTLYRPQHPGRHRAVALFHGCGGVGQNILRMAQILAGKGYVAVVVDSFGARGTRDACTSRWPTVEQAVERVADIRASVAFLSARADVDATRIAVMGYSYGGGVALLYALDGEPAARATIAVYPDCALQDRLGATLANRKPLLLTMGELDDWTPVRQCEALLARIRSGRDLVETRVYPGAHHSFDAVGLPVRYLASAGNRSKPNNCCGAHYGYNAAAWTAFQRDVEAFLARALR
ncbi:MAG: dienelactone hydrolase family protein [Reyranellaceae bacterium]